MYHQEQTNSNSGLLRFRSAPTSLFSNFTNGISGGDSEESKPLGNGYSLSSQLPPQYPRHRLTTTQLGTTMEMDNSNNSSSYRGVGSSNLMRQSSSPAGLFSHLNSQNGYGALRGFGNYRVGNGTNGDVGLSSNRLKGQMNFFSGMASSFGMLSQIPEIDNEDIKLGNGSRDSPFYSPGYACGLWNDSSHFPENFSVLKRDLDDDGKLFGGTQNAEPENRPHILSHRLSLPMISAEMAAMEKLMHFQDTVPCKVRAKRGCATHPRSIAERVRRTRISERMRKLQELVPNMDKQTNTADMLDLAVDYIKELQKQHKILSENWANCKCSGIQKRLPNLSA